MTDHEPAGGAGSATIRSVAARAGVSKSLVSLVLQGSPRVSERRRQAVLDAIQELGYRPDPVARSLAEGRSRTVGVVIEDLRNPWFIEVLDGLRPELHDHGLRPLLTERRTESGAVQALRELRVEGLVLVGTLSPDLAVTTHGIPTVVAGSREPAPERVDVIAGDDEIGVQLAARHLLDLGHRRIAHVVGCGRVGRLRRLSFEAEMRAAGCTPVTAAGDMTESGGYTAAQQLLGASNRPTALIAANDLSAVGALAAAEELGLRVPEDLSLVGYDNTSLARLRPIALTTVDNAGPAVGGAAARTLLRRMHEPETSATTTLLPPRLVIRNSTARCP
jgi:DNA-binding LacI/PurR family transcriptional regulator